MNTLMAVYMVFFDLMLLASMRNSEKVLFYFGFLRGTLSKAIFLLFLSILVFPVNTQVDGQELNTYLGGFLMLVAVL